MDSRGLFEIHWLEVSIDVGFEGLTPGTDFNCTFVIFSGESVLGGKCTAALLDPTSTPLHASPIRSKRGNTAVRS